ncbi:MAG TPA: MnhB domain-containing protein [Acidimicrobiales bacterium]|jgi:multicomponent Na+:H+ antiporter subunit B|nr:MnhB domain-containing protein [Acidimicrobiales bacterium]
MSRPPEVVDAEPVHRRMVGVLLAAAVAAVLGVALLRLPREGAALPTVARQAMDLALPAWHTTEPVNEIVYGTRGFDTFGETFLLLAAIVGITTITRRREHRRGFIGEELAGWREQSEVGEPAGRDAEQAEVQDADRAEQGDSEQRESDGSTPDASPVGTHAVETAATMTVVVRGAVRIVAPILAIAGLYLVAWGYSPGGGFPGGAVLLGVVLFVYVAYGYRKVEPVIRPDVVEPLELAGALAIITIELFGLFLKGSFSANFLPLGPVGTIRSGGVLQAFSASELIEVGTGLTLAVFGLLGMAHDWSQEEPESAQGEGRDGPLSPNRSSRP